MRLILDTHIMLWALTDDAALPSRARELMLDPDNDVFVSIASIWEVAIKHQLNRGRPGDMPIDAPKAFDSIDTIGFNLLPIEPSHIVEVGRLPPHHGDPFDRLLVAQALAEPMRLITADKTLPAYGDHVLLV